MKYFLTFLPVLLVLMGQPVFAAPPDGHSDFEKDLRAPGKKRACDDGRDWCKQSEGMCRPEMRGRCGKRRGDWYGARQPVGGALEARRQLQSYYAGQEYTVSGVTEKRWGFKAEILDKDGNIVDKVMIDKRSGRIRSIY